MGFTRSKSGDARCHCGN